MEPLDVVEQAHSNLIPGTIPAVIHPVTFEHPEEALASSVVAAVTHRAHTLTSFFELK